MGFFELALVSSVSPQTLAVVLFLLSGNRGVRHAWIFTSGTLITSVASGLLVATGIGDLGIHLDGFGNGRHFPTADLVGGSVLIAFAAYVVWRHLSARSHPRHADHAREERRLARMVESSRVSFVVGLIFGLPGIWYALALAETNDHGAALTLAVVLVFSAISYSWAWGPILWFMVDGERALRLLAGLRSAVGRHRIAIVVGVLVLVGVYLVVLGVLTS